MDKSVNKFFEQCIEAERSLLSLGWMQPTNLNNIGCKLQLDNQHFCQPELAFIYTYICLNAQAGKHPDIDECVRMAIKLRVDIDEHYLFNLILWADIQDGMLRTYAETVRDFARKRERAQRCFQEFRHIVNNGISSPNKFAGKHRRKRQVTYV